MSDLTIMESIARLVPHGSRVLDLGCGDGAMLDYLQRTRGCSGYGIEISDTIRVPVNSGMAPNAPEAPT